ncbi:MAG: hypothetical protein CM15mP49_17810 [Actinomycetota bacterium]|nr:MAG: hypothetical protein CM15mP49_17810 [Actinomycetota bacterium]
MAILSKTRELPKTNLCNEANKLERPLLIHGLADDNVVAAHTFQLSQALLEAGKPHEVLPLTGLPYDPTRNCCREPFTNTVEFYTKIFRKRTQENE